MGYGGGAGRRARRADHHDLGAAGAVEDPHQTGEPGPDLGVRPVVVVEAALDDHEVGAAAHRGRRPLGERHPGTGAGVGAEAGAGEPGHVHGARQPRRPRVGRPAEAEAGGPRVADHDDPATLTGHLRGAGSGVGGEPLAPVGVGPGVVGDVHHEQRDDEEDEESAGDDRTTVY